jgi:hypothetical protein
MVTNTTSPSYCPYDSTTLRVLTTITTPAFPSSSDQLIGRRITLTLRLTAHGRRTVVGGPTPRLERSYSSLSSTLRRYGYSQGYSHLVHPGPTPIVRARPLDATHFNPQALLPGFNLANISPHFPRETDPSQWPPANMHIILERITTNSFAFHRPSIRGGGTPNLDKGPRTHPGADTTRLDASPPHHLHRELGAHAPHTYT